MEKPRWIEVFALASFPKIAKNMTKVEDDSVCCSLNVKVQNVFWNQNIIVICPKNRMNPFCGISFYIHQTVVEIPARISKNTKTFLLKIALVMTNFQSHWICEIIASRLLLFGERTRRHFELVKRKLSQLLRDCGNCFSFFRLNPNRKIDVITCGQ